MASVLRLPSGQHASWAVVDQLGVPVEPFNRYLNHLYAIERSTNTIRSYASDLRFFSDYLEEAGLPWTAVTGETLGYFVAYLRRSHVVTAGRRKGELIQRSEKTVNRAMAAVASFYKFMALSSGDRTYERLSAHAQIRYRPIATVVDGVVGTAGMRETSTFGPRLRARPKPIEVLSADQVHQIVVACHSKRDKLLISMLYLTGMRIGQALSLRHSDINVPERSVTLRRRDQATEIHANKSTRSAVVPIPVNLVRLYLDYQYEEYLDLDSDYVFVNLWKGVLGSPMSYQNVYDLVQRLQRATGIHGWSPHTLRHTYVSRLSEAGVPIDIISHLVTHASIRTTVETYQHLDVSSLRTQLVKCGVWEKMA